MINKPEVEKAITHLLSAVGEEPGREGLAGTPDRVARAYTELLRGYDQTPEDILKTTFASEGYDSMVVLRNIDFFSMCEHHMLPFYGTCTVGYVPAEGGRVVGLSKLARLVEVYGRRFQIQERLTKQIAGALEDTLKPLGVGVVINAKHLCMAARGVGKQNASMTTSDLRGVFRDQDKARAEFLSLAKG